ncbi:hypothetical protein Pse7367_0355 [Thalassoporum mexicanum PCC 7367]|uniref:hypothetical protein n=1 Tax=Thalassoporum mexicanum TaxID=3457544 RepID=UPI00029FC3D7|nr:hypothetical protein [Pseudanabaena sp. PCC 7367]AFY68666.1 hypothetical protein Pse7367_0355 [Pseudanabaena sp. PCC 7367]
MPEQPIESNSVNSPANSPDIDAATNAATNWYIHRQPSGVCLITNHQEAQGSLETWGPFANQNEAIAKRVGLIRAGKCIPA